MGTLSARPVSPQCIYDSRLWQLGCSSNSKLTVPSTGKIFCDFEYRLLLVLHAQHMSSFVWGASNVHISSIDVKLTVNSQSKFRMPCFQVSRFHFIPGISQLYRVTSFLCPQRVWKRVKSRSRVSGWLIYIIKIIMATNSSNGHDCKSAYLGSAVGCLRGLLMPVAKCTPLVALFT